MSVPSMLTIDLSSFSVAIFFFWLSGTNPKDENRTAHRRRRPKSQNNAFKQRLKHLYSDQHAITGTACGPVESSTPRVSQMLSVGHFSGGGEGDGDETPHMPI